MDEVTSSFQKRLRLTSEECSTLVLQHENRLDVPLFHQSLLVQVRTKTRFNKRAFIDMMQALWGDSCSVRFKELNEASFLCHFICMKDKERVLQGAPWHFERALVLIEEVSGSVIPNSVSIDHALFWIQVHNVPLCCMTKSVGEAIGSHLGECIMVDSDEEGLCFGKFMRVRVRLDIRCPLRR